MYSSKITFVSSLNQSTWYQCISHINSTFLIYHFSKSSTHHIHFRLCWYQLYCLVLLYGTRTAGMSLMLSTLSPASPLLFSPPLLLFLLPSCWYFLQVIDVSVLQNEPWCCVLWYSPSLPAIILVWEEVEGGGGKGRKRIENQLRGMGRGRESNERVKRGRKLILSLLT